jgi:hypothetical protein
MSKPTHKAYVVQEVKEGSERKGRWLEVGAVWPHKNGSGFDVVIAARLAVSGRVVCVPPQPNEKADAGTGEA